MNKLNECKQILQSTKETIFASPEAWKSFLKFSAKIYKYDFTSALLIYSQRPDATALAPLEIWNRVGRRVNAGAKGIPTIADTEYGLSLNYLFDVSDTNGDSSTLPKHWELKADDENIVLTDLEDRYGIQADREFFQPRFHAVIDCILNQSYNLFGKSITEAADGTPLANIPKNELPNLLYDFLSDSITYMVYCRIDPESPLLNNLIFDGLHLFSDSRHINIIGNAAVNQSSRLLRQIESSVKQIEFEQMKEQRRMKHVNRIQGKGRTVIPGTGNIGIGEPRAAEQIRDGVQEIPAGTEPGKIRGIGGRTGIDESLPSGGTGSERVRGQDLDTAPQEQTGTTDSGPHAAGAVQQLAVQDGGGIDTERHRIPEITEQLTLQAVSQEAAFSFVQKTADTAKNNQISMFDLPKEEPKSGTGSAFEPASVIPEARTAEANERFSVFETDNGYAVWDDANNGIYVDGEGITEEFTSEWEANSYLAHVKSIEATKVTHAENKLDPSPANPTKTGTSSAFSMSAAQRMNYRYDSMDEVTGGQKTHYKANIEAIRTLQTIEAGNRLATSEEQTVLSKYVGWGGIPQAFDKDNDKWQTEYKELKELLTPEEYETARASTLTAFYTPPAVIHAVHTALENFGFHSGNILEPSCGIGRFFGFLPQTAVRNSHLYGVELDTLTGRIAKQLYQNADIQIKGFEKTDFPDNFFDVAIGNIPFGEFRVPDARYEKNKFLIHDYFFAKTLDKVRPGGIVAFVTSKGTLDKANLEVRKYLAQRAELIGAVRLPNTMMKAEANTNVTADLIFLQKRERMVDIEPEWVNLTYMDGNIPINTYFADHQEMMLGTMTFDDSMYGSRKDTALIPHEGSDWREELPAAIQSLNGFYSEPEIGMDSEENTVTIPANPQVKNFTYTLIDDKLYYRENSVMTLQTITGIREQRVRGMVSIRDALREVIRLQLADMPDADIKIEQRILNSLYDTFTKKHGSIISSANKTAFSLDSDYPLLSSLENVDDDGNIKKADIFSKRTIRPPMVIDHADTAMEALPLSLDRKGGADIAYIAELTNQSESKILQDLSGILYKNPETEHYETADEYLSGNVREKLEIAQAAAQSDEQYAVNVEALKLVQPKDLDASQIDVRLGSPLFSTEDIKQFILDTLKPNAYYTKKLNVVYVPAQALWKINGIYHVEMQRSNLLAGKTFGTHRMDAYELTELSLNQKTATVRDKQPDDSYIVNQVETSAAREKQRVIHKAFEEWAFKEPERRERLVRKYNDTYNNIRLRQYDGLYLTFPGMTPEIMLQEHQKNGVARILSSGNTLLAHCVGAGKTYTMIAAAMECKRLGLCHKSMIVVPGHLIDQWGADILKLYPGANVLLATKKDFEKKNRQRLISRIATGDYDAVVIAQSSFEKIPISPERRERLLKKQIGDIMTSIELAKDENGEEWTIKNMERTKKSLEEQLVRLMNDSRKDDLLTFEELGVDQLFVDEAHYYKNLFTATKMSNVAGVGQQKAQKASDLLMKCRYINELNGGQRGVVFATGTPISNSMSEMFVMQSYLQPEELENRGITHFDAWAASFGRVTSSLELTPDGTQYRYKSRFAQFVNLPELMTVYSLVSDIQSADMLKLPVPRIKGDKAITVVAQPSELQKEPVEEIVERFGLIHAGAVKPWEDNALKATNDGRFGALDMRILHPKVEDYEGSKVNHAVENIFNVWQQTTEKHLTQMVFCDLSTPKHSSTEITDGSTAHVPFTSVYEDMKQKLVCKGIPTNEIAFIHDASTEAQKEQLFSDFRAGKIRILFGSTSRMGAGTNAQRKLVALHHMDAPWRPADLEQREGRILRQGNENEEVGIYRYVTEGTFDAYSWQILEQKQRFISQVSRGECVERHAADIDDTALDYATVKMLSSKDPRIKEREELRVRVAELNQLKVQHNFERYSMEDSLLKTLPQTIAREQQAIENVTKDIALRDSHPQEKFQIELFGQLFNDKELAGRAILQKADTYRKIGEYLPIGIYRGFRLELTYSGFSSTHSLLLCGAARHYTELGQSTIGCAARLDNLLKGFEDTIAKCQQNIDGAQQQVKEIKAQLSKPWEHEKEYEEKTEKLNKLDIEMAAEMGPNKEQVLSEECEISNDMASEFKEDFDRSLSEKLQEAKERAAEMNSQNYKISRNLNLEQ